MDKLEFTLEQIKNYDGKSGIYALLFGDRIIYIGQSKNLGSRLREHRREGKFKSMLKDKTANAYQLEMYKLIDLFRDQISFTILKEVEQKSLNYWEKKLIEQHKPKYNYVGTKVPYKKFYRKGR